MTANWTLELVTARDDRVWRPGGDAAEAFPSVALTPFCSIDAPFVLYSRYAARAALFYLVDPRPATPVIWA